MSQPEFRARVILEAGVSPSEDVAKVAAALGGIIGRTAEEVSQGTSEARLVTDDSRALAFVRDQLRDRHVRSAARRQLLLNKTGRSTSLMLNRQAAAAGVLNVCGSAEESPLGPIVLTIESHSLDKVVDWLTAYSEG